MSLSQTLYGTRDVWRQCRLVPRSIVFCLCVFSVLVWTGEGKGKLYLCVSCLFEFTCGRFQIAKCAFSKQFAALSWVVLFNHNVRNTPFSRQEYVYIKTLKLNSMFCNI